MREEGKNGYVKNRAVSKNVREEGKDGSKKNSRQQKDGLEKTCETLVFLDFITQWENFRLQAVISLFSGIFRYFKV